jgi:hypothetical protein
MTALMFEPFVLGSPKITPPPPPAKWASGTHTWTAGGRTWDLSTGAQGVRLQAGVRGLNSPEFIRYTSESPAVSGATYRGYRASERDIMWPLWVFNGDGSAEWLQVDREFWASLHPDRTGVWTYISRDGVTRTLTCRFVSDNGKTYDDDPGLFGWQFYQVSLVAEDPFWRGTAIRKRFGAASESTPLYGPLEDPGAPSYYIGGQFNLDSGKVSNPGDEPAWPRWELHGPFTAAEVGIGGKSIEVPFTVADGEWLYIDTAPSVRSALLGTAVDDNGNAVLGAGTETDMSSDLGDVAWAAIPPGEDLPLDMTMTGTGHIWIEIAPAYHRAY